MFDIRFGKEMLLFDVEIKVINKNIKIRFPSDISTKVRFIHRKSQQIYQFPSDITMKVRFIHRKKEIKELVLFYKNGKPELVTIYCRRRVDKTFY